MVVVAAGVGAVGVVWRRDPLELGLERGLGQEREGGEAGAGPGEDVCDHEARGPERPGLAGHGMELGWRERVGLVPGTGVRGGGPGAHSQGVLLRHAGAGGVLRVVSLFWRNCSGNVGSLYCHVLVTVSN